MVINMMKLKCLNCKKDFYTPTYAGGGFSFCRACQIKKNMVVNMEQKYRKEVDFLLRSIYQDNKTEENKNNMLNYQKLDGVQ